MERSGAVDVHLSFGPSLVSAYIIEFGTDDQKQTWLPGIASGDIIPALCITEAKSGSDVVNMATKAVSDGSDLIISGKKVWITNGSICDIVVLFVRDEECITNNANKGISCIVVELKKKWSRCS